MNNFKINKKWLNRFGILIVFLFSVSVMCVVCTHITETIKQATDAVAFDFISKTEGGLVDGLQRIFGSL